MKQVRYKVKLSNWFEIFERLEGAHLDTIMTDPSLLEVGENEWQLLLQSKLAFDAASKDTVSEERDASIVWNKESEYVYFYLSDQYHEQQFTV